ncbi:MAG: hypothetical protein K2X62_01225 [Beijerinckiaceae bacterium]|uniref:hypothetical protein n=1 Tax=Methylobacterium sp. TaxID=409 RepID=UPI0025FBF62D|nr:hypothetical protein [Methylobacterium sp.]MBX9738660.1 hypothetical protein [Beijerinckiaceae bacterium]MBX9934381.1 hypothetical protein [Methylobacterium sp.]
MDRSIPLLLIGLVFGGCIGFAVAASNGITLDGHDHADNAHHEGHTGSDVHDHGAMLNLPAEASAPTLDLHLTPDPSSGWNLHMVTENFAFSPRNASLAHIPGEGHAHVYIDGVKLGRFYGPWVHLDNLPEGDVTVEVTLNANDHRLLGVNGRPLSETVTIAN